MGMRDTTPAGELRFELHDSRGAHAFATLLASLQIAGVAFTVRQEGTTVWISIRR